MKKFIIKLIKRSTYTYSLTIPKDIVEKYGWKGKQKLVVTDKGRGRVEIRDWRNTR